MTYRLLYVAACSLVLATIVHICIVFLIPLFGEKDAARSIMQNSALNRFEILSGNDKFGYSNSDPFFKQAACRFDLNLNGIEVTGAKSNLFWSASVFNARGRVIYSLNQRTAIGNNLRIIVVNPVQMANIRQLQPAELETSIVVETSEQTGFVIIRTLQPDGSWTSTVDDFLNNLKCDRYSETGS